MVAILDRSRAHCKNAGLCKSSCLRSTTNPALWAERGEVQCFARGNETASNMPSTKGCTAHRSYKRLGGHVSHSIPRLGTIAKFHDRFGHGPRRATHMLRR